MSRTHGEDDAEESPRTATQDARSSGAPDTSRRTFMRTAAAGVGAAGLGSMGAGSATAAQEDGPGQTISTPRLEVDGNVLVDPDGNTVTLRGLNIADPKLLNLTAQQRGKNAEHVIRYLTNRDLGMHPRVIRLPIEPGNIIEMAPVPVSDNLDNGDYPRGEFDTNDLEDYCEEHLDDVVDLCAERNVYCIVDYHRHWGDGEMSWDDNPELSEEVHLFWDFMAEKYGDRDHVLFELYNEPTMPGMWGDHTDHWASTWIDWVNTAQPWLETIREHTDTVTFIGSPGWSNSPEGALLTEDMVPDYMQEDFVQFDDPADNIGFTYHIYPAHDPSKAEDWEDTSSGNNGGGVAGVYEEYPLFVTEFGWDGELQGTYNYSDPFFPLEGTTSEFGEPFMDWLESSDAISWTAWCADPIWKPVMIERTFTERTQHDDEDAIGDPYTEDLPVYCEEPPCEWGIFGEDVGDYDQKAGGFIRETLEELKDHNVPDYTGDEGPSAPTSVTVESTTETTVQVSWTSVSEADEYVVTVDGSQEATPTDTGHEVTGLTAGTTYTIGVAARNADGTSTSTTATATTDGGDGENACEQVGAAGGEQVDGQWVCDVDDDGLHRDVTADGDVGQDDVVHFFENQHRDAWKQPELFDFSGSDSVGHGDVVALFETVSL